MVRRRSFTPFGEVQPYSEFAISLSQTLTTRWLAMIPPLFGLPTGSSLCLVGHLQKEKRKQTASKYNIEESIYFNLCETIAKHGHCPSRYINYTLTDYSGQNFPQYSSIITSQK